MSHLTCSAPIRSRMTSKKKKYITIVFCVQLSDSGVQLSVAPQRRRVGAKRGGADSLLRLRLVFDIKNFENSPKSGGASALSRPYYATPLCA